MINLTNETYIIAYWYISSLPSIVISFILYKDSEQLELIKGRYTFKEEGLSKIEDMEYKNGDEEEAIKLVNDSINTLKKSFTQHSGVDIYCDFFIVRGTSEDFFDVAKTKKYFNISTDLTFSSLNSTN